MHLVHCDRQVRKELDALLADDRVKGFVLERQLEYGALVPLNRGTRGRPAGPPTRRATATMPGFRSRPVTRPEGPTTSASRRATNPVPQARSSTEAPGCTCARSMTASTNGTINTALNRSYCSGAFPDTWNPDNCVTSHLLSPTILTT